MNIITQAAEMIKLAVTLSGVFEGVTIVEFVLGVVLVAFKMHERLGESL